MIGEQLFRERLATRQHQTARIAAGIRHAQQFQIARHILVIGGFAVELFEQVENHIRLPFLDRLANGAQFVLNADRGDFMAGRTQGGDDVILRLPNMLLLFAVAFQRIRRREIRMHQHQDAEWLHG